MKFLIVNALKGSYCHLKSILDTENFDKLICVGEILSDNETCKALFEMLVKLEITQSIGTIVYSPKDEKILQGDAPSNLPEGLLLWLAKFNMIDVIDTDNPEMQISVLNGTIEDTLEGEYVEEDTEGEENTNYTQIIVHGNSGTGESIVSNGKYSMVVCPPFSQKDRGLSWYTLLDTKPGIHKTHPNEFAIQNKSVKVGK